MKYGIFYNKVVLQTVHFLNTKIGTLKRWKTLAAAAVKTDSKRDPDAIVANFSATFSEIKIDNKAAKPVADIADKAKVSPSGNNVTIAVKKK
ncbi:YrpD family protein [Bacillus glycinifermentans]|nr:YrpD family protein [Bacillus glycinifermentans]MEC0485080.1 YrpD family protein [Bacillus glycinifermentans]MEC3605850.1 YrpD family protein [Bacillus glycinifermentans]